MVLRSEPVNYSDAQLSCRDSGGVCVSGHLLSANRGKDSKIEVITTEF